MSWNTGLTGPALNIASVDHNRLRVVAGPGTGKSFAIMRRVARLLEAGQDPQRILAVTFTRNAASSLVSDLNDIGVEGCREVSARTLHSYCFSLLNREEVFTYLSRVPRPIITFLTSGSLQYEGSMLLSDLIHEDHAFGGKRDCTKRIRAFEAAWARLQSQQPGWPEDDVDRLFERRLLEWLIFHRAMLIGELVPEALRFLRGNPMSTALASFDHVIVDEYQDLNRAEQEVIDLLAGSRASAVVGDPDQSIYSFRYANPEGISDFSVRHATTHDEHLTQCRRCPTRVVGLAENLIEHNHDLGIPPRLVPREGNPEGEIHIVQWPNADGEIQGVSSYVNYLLSEGGYSPEEILILTPRRRLAYRIRDSIADQGHPIHSSYQEEALEDLDAQRALAALTLLNNPEDRVALRWWLGHRSQGGLSASYSRLRQHCESTGDSPRSALQEIADGTLVVPGTQHLLAPYRELEDILRSLSDSDLTDIVDALLPAESEECATLRDLAVGNLEDCEDVGQLYDRVRTQITQPEIPEGDFVRIMSLQKSKGLTSKVVIVTGCVEGMLPVANSDATREEQQEILREQRRLFYVAITRCTEILVVSSFANIDYGLARNLGVELGQRRTRRGARTIASRFIDELGSDAPWTRNGSQWQNGRFSE